MNKIALAERFEGYAKVFASECPLSIDLQAMGAALRKMPDEKFASILNGDFDKESAFNTQDKVLGNPLIKKYDDKGAPGQKGMTEEELKMKSQTPQYQQKSENLANEEVEAFTGQVAPTYGPSGQRMHQRGKEDPAGGQKGVTITPQQFDEIKKKDPMFAKKVEEVFSRAASEEVEANQNTEVPKAKDKPVGDSWSKAASAAVAQALVKDIVGMDKSVCCDTKRHLSKEEMPDGEKKAETPASLKKDETPDVAESLDSDIVAKSNGPVKKEAKAKTIKCPGCGGKVLEATKYCVKCKKKIGGKSSEENKEAGKKSTEQELSKLKAEKAEEEKAKKMEETREKSRPKKKEATEDTTVVAEGFEFEASIQDIEIAEDEQKKLESLFN